MRASTCTQDQASPNCQQHPLQNASTKQQARQKQKPSHQQTGFPQTPQNIPIDTALSIRGEKPHLLPPGAQAQVPPHTKLHNSPEQVQPLRAGTKRKKEYDTTAWEKETTNTEEVEKTEKYWTNEGTG